MTRGRRARRTSGAWHAIGSPRPWSNATMPDRLDTPYPGPEHQPFVYGSSMQRVVMVHGFPGTPAELRALGERIAARGWEARGILLPGFGPEIAELGERTRSDWLDAVLGALDSAREGAERVVVLGFSMGAALALAAARKRPDLNGAVLLAPFHGLQDWRARFLPVLAPFFPRLKPFADADFDDPEVRAEVRRIFPEADFDDPEIRRRLREDVALPARTLRELHALGREAARSASEVRVPTLFVQARDDRTVSPSGARRLAIRPAGPVAYVEVPGTHEFPMAPDREGFGEAVEALDAALQRWSGAHLP